MRRTSFLGLACVTLLLAGCRSEARPGAREVSPSTGRADDPPADPNALARPPRAIATH